MRDWRKAGLTIPQGIEAATNEYRDEEDLIGQFINERCLRGQDKSVGATLFRNDLNDYLGTGYGAKTVKKHLTDRGIQYKRISAGPNKGNWGFMGMIWPRTLQVIDPRKSAQFSQPRAS